MKSKTDRSETQSFIPTESETEHIPEDALIYGEEIVKLYEVDKLKVMALQGLDICVKKGELIAVIGKSGSGKSTLLNMIGCLETLSAGKLYIAGRDLSIIKEKELEEFRKKTIGFVWQNSSRNLLPYMTALENVMAPMVYTHLSEKEKRARATELLEAVGIGHLSHRFPRQMSGGEQQRNAIAVALANHPQILLADEPTGAVDSKTSEAIFELFQKLNRERNLTIVIVTHDRTLAHRVNRVIEIADGKVSTEKVLRTDAVGFGEIDDEQSHEQYSVLDKARRVQLSEEDLLAAGIEGNRVKVEVVDGKIVIGN